MEALTVGKEGPKVGKLYGLQVEQELNRLGALIGACKVKSHAVKNKCENYHKYALGKERMMKENEVSGDCVEQTKVGDGLEEVKKLKVELVRLDEESEKLKKEFEELVERIKNEIEKEK